MQSNHGFEGQIYACWRHKMTQAEIDLIRTGGFLVSVIHGRYYISCPLKLFLLYKYFQTPIGCIYGFSQI